MATQMLRLGVVAAVLVCSGTFLLAQGRSSAHASIEHTCGLTDRQFIQDYQVVMDEVGVYGNDYLHGSARADQVVSAAQNAAAVMQSSNPYDPSLILARTYAPAMFLSYANAVKARAAGGSGSRAMYLAYSVGQRVQDVLRAGAPGLSAAGCDVSGLLQ